MPRTSSLVPCLLLAVLLLGGARPGALRAQAPPPAAWSVFVDGRDADAFAGLALPPDSLDAGVRLVLARLHGDGHLLASVDSARVDTTGEAVRVALYVRRGPELRVGRVRLEGAAALDERALRALFATRSGERFDPARLEEDLGAVLARYDAAGYGLAAVHLDDVAVRFGEEGAPVVDVAVRVEEGRPLRIAGVELPEGARTRPGYAARLAGVRSGAPLASYRPEEVQRRLEASGLFERVGPPRLEARGDSTAVLRLDVDEGPPGAFDLVVGYQPSTGGGGRFVGNGHLVLRNLFGGGRRLALRLDQLPGEVSALDASVRDPYVLDRPVAAALRFEGLQQDSSFTRERYTGELGVYLAPGFEVFGTLTQEATRPGLAGARVVGGRQRVARSDALFTGVGLRYASLDAPLNPRRGLLVEVRVESGRSSRDVRGDSSSVRTRLGQERLRATTRLYVPLLRRVTAVAGADAAALASTMYDVSDLFRFGGATSLRGYDEDAYRGRLVARGLGEVRYALDRSSYAYVFLDVGYVDRPAIDAVPALRRVLPGYGGGMVFATALGLVNASYGLSRQGGRLAGRVHVGLSVGL